MGEGQGRAGGQRSLQAWQLAPHAPIIGGVLAWLALGRPTGALAAALIVATVAFAVAAHGAAWRATQAYQDRRDALAVELATTETELAQRAAVSQLFVHLARRNQSLLDRQIGLLVELEQVERDPDGLAELFKLDHLATRIRRNAESLLVLSGEETPRRWGRPVAMADVVRAAVAEVEDYTRASIIIDEHLALSGRAVADVAHLLAELVENALTYSPPDTRVTVRNHLTRDSHRSCLITIEDRGIGMPAADLAEANALLAAPTEVGLALTQQLGFHVVGRLGARHGIDVSLAPTPGGGVTAVVKLPEALFPTDDAIDLDELRATRPAAATVTSAGVAAPAPVAPREPVAADSMAGSMAGPGVAAAPLRAVPAAAAAPLRALPLSASGFEPDLRFDQPAPEADPLVDPSSLPVAARTAAVVTEPADATEAAALRRRTPGLHLGAAMPMARPALSAETQPGSGRSADEVRAMLSRFQTSQAAGREHAETDRG